MENDNPIERLHKKIEEAERKRQIEEQEKARQRQEEREIEFYARQRQMASRPTIIPSPQRQQPTQPLFYPQQQIQQEPQPSERDIRIARAEAKCTQMMGAVCQGGLVNEVISNLGTRRKR